MLVLFDIGGNSVSFLHCRQFERDPAGVGHWRSNVRRENAGQICIRSSCKAKHTHKFTLNPLLLLFILPNNHIYICSLRCSLSILQHEAKKDILSFTPVASGRVGNASTYKPTKQQLHSGPATPSLCSQIIINLDSQ